MIETRWRSIAKSITWRITAIVSTILLLLMFGIPLWTSAKVVGAGTVLIMILYYIHERGWNKIEWGVIK